MSHSGGEAEELGTRRFETCGTDGRLAFGMIDAAMRGVRCVEYDDFRSYRQVVDPSRSE